MRNYFFLALVAIVGLVSRSNKQFPQSGTSIPPAKLQSLIEKKKVQLIDVRTEGEYKEGHIAGAGLIDVLQEASFQQQIQTLDRNKSYVVYCRSGKRSKQAMDLMQKQGFKKVVDLDGGIQAWKGATEK